MVLTVEQEKLLAAIRRIQRVNREGMQLLTRLAEPIAGDKLTGLRAEVADLFFEPLFDHMLYWTGTSQAALRQVLWDEGVGIVLAPEARNVVTGDAPTNYLPRAIRRAVSRGRENPYEVAKEIGLPLAAELIDEQLPDLFLMDLV